MVARTGGYYSKAFKGFWGVTQGGPIPPGHFKCGGGRGSVTLGLSDGLWRLGIRVMGEGGAKLRHLLIHG